MRGLQIACFELNHLLLVGVNTLNFILYNFMSFILFIFYTDFNIESKSFISKGNSIINIFIFFYLLFSAFVNSIFNIPVIWGLIPLILLNIIILYVLWHDLPFLNLRYLGILIVIHSILLCKELCILFAFLVKNFINFNIFPILVIFTIVTSIVANQIRITLIHGSIVENMEVENGKQLDLIIKKINFLYQKITIFENTQSSKDDEFWIKKIFEEINLLMEHYKINDELMLNYILMEKNKYDKIREFVNHSIKEFLAKIEVYYQKVESFQLFKISFYINQLCSYKQVIEMLLEAQNLNLSLEGSMLIARYLLFCKKKILKKLSSQSSSEENELANLLSVYKDNKKLVDDMKEITKLKIGIMNYLLGNDCSILEIYYRSLKFSALIKQLTDYVDELKQKHIINYKHLFLYHRFSNDILLKNKKDIFLNQMSKKFEENQLNKYKDNKSESSIAFETNCQIRFGKVSCLHCKNSKDRQVNVVISINFLF